MRVYGARLRRRIACFRVQAGLVGFIVHDIHRLRARACLAESVKERRKHATILGTNDGERRPYVSLEARWILPVILAEDGDTTQGLLHSDDRLIVEFVVV